MRGGRVTGVRTADGEVVPADAVVLATGAAVPGTLAGLGVHVPDATTNALLVRTPPVETRLRVVLNTPRVAVRPAPGGGLVLDAGWSEDEVVARDDGTFEVHESTVQGLLQEASRVLAGHPDLTADVRRRRPQAGARRGRAPGARRARRRRRTARRLHPQRGDPGPDRR